LLFQTACIRLHPVVLDWNRFKFRFQVVCVIDAKLCDFHSDFCCASNLDLHKACNLSCSVITVRRAGKQTQIYRFHAATAILVVNRPLSASSISESVSWPNVLKGDWTRLCPCFVWMVLCVFCVSFPWVDVDRVRLFYAIPRAFCLLVMLVRVIVCRPTGPTSASDRLERLVSEWGRWSGC